MYNPRIHTHARRSLRRPILLCLVGFAVLAMSSAVRAQPCPPLRVGNPAGNYIVPGVKGNIRYSGDLALDAYVQTDGLSRPSIVLIHGGGMWSGSRIAHLGQLLETLTRGGYNWFSLDYRLGGLARTADALADIRAALAFVRCHASELRINPARLVLVGEDSGAQLAALLASEALPGVIGGVLVGGYYDLTATPAFARTIDRGILLRVSPLTRSRSRMPPLLVVHGGADDESPIALARRYCSEVAHGSGRCEMLEVEGASHRSENWWPSQWHYKAKLIAWLNALSGVDGFSFRPQPGAIQKDIVYDASSNLALDAFTPPSTAPVPAVIVVHGGGWEAGDKVTYVSPMFEPLAQSGLAWFSIDYRLTPAVMHQDQLDDLRRAIQFVRDQHARFNVDPSRIFLLGESASGQMVAQLATGDRALAGVVSFYGVYDFEAMVTDASPRSLLVRLFRRTILDDQARAELKRYSPLHTVRQDMPPMLLVNGTGERLWAQAQAFDRRLTELGVRHEVVALDGAPHGMENWEGHPEWTVYKRRVVDWIRSTR